MQASSSSKYLARYAVRTSDVLSDNRVNISLEQAETIIWYKDRFLADEEIIEHVVDNATSTLLWTIHKPLRGWYLRLRAPSFAPNTFISLLPVPPSSPYHTPAAMSFSCRTNFPPVAPPSPTQPPASATAKSSLDSDATLSDPASCSPSHTYPPPASPPSVLVSPPSPSSLHTKLDQLTPTLRPKPRTQITHFLLTPHSQSAIPQAPEGGLFTRALRALKNNAPSQSNSFTLSPFPSTPPGPPAPTPSSTSAPAEPHHDRHHHPHYPHLLAPPTPLLVFHDTTPVFTVSSSSGVLEIDSEEVLRLGVDISFWIAVALTYGEFLGDRDSYLAAVTD